MGAGVGELGRMVKIAREGQGLTVLQLAHLLGVSAPVVSDIENGRRKISEQRISHLGQILGLDVSQIAAACAKWRGHVRLTTGEGPEKDVLATELASRWERIGSDHAVAILKAIRNTGGPEQRV